MFCRPKHKPCLTVLKVQAWFSNTSVVIKWKSFDNGEPYQGFWIEIDFVLDVRWVNVLFFRCSKLGNGECHIGSVRLHFIDRLGAEHMNAFTGSRDCSRCWVDKGLKQGRQEGILCHVVRPQCGIVMHHFFGDRENIWAGDGPCFIFAIEHSHSSLCMNWYICV